VRRVISVSILIALLVLPATGATAEENGVRSGTIVVASLSGLGGGYPRGCELTADCLAWLASRCDPALAGRDPALETSIEDVADLAPADALFEHEPARAYATVQFWQQDCTEIGSRTQIESGKALLIIPSSARWMTPGRRGLLCQPHGAHPRLDPHGVPVERVRSGFTLTGRAI
jgi:hypothetical protein